MDLFYLREMEQQDLQQFIQAVRSAAKEGTLIRLGLHKKVSKTHPLQKVTMRPVELKSGFHLSANFTFATQDETKNFSVEEALERIGNWLGNSFLQADMETTTQQFQLLISKKRVAKLLVKTKKTSTPQPDLAHNQQKNRLVPEDRPYLEQLGISRKGAVKPSGQKKYKQIDKYIEIIESLLGETKLAGALDVVDMGSGKGYLTFALFDYLQRSGYIPKMKGIELRPDLVETTSKIAKQLGWLGLTFEALDIREFSAQKVDLLIALHACDTATDEAIAQGIKNNAQIIVVAPCCHKQIRKQMAANNSLKPLLQYGILLERQAELVTDGLRALILQQHGYQTKVFEFVSTEHTGKNVMITAVKTGNPTDVTSEIAALKAEFGIEEHALEALI